MQTQQSTASVSMSQLIELSAIMRALAVEHKKAAPALRQLADQYEMAAAGGFIRAALPQDRQR